MHVKAYGATSAAMSKICRYLIFLSTLNVGKNSVTADTIFIPVCLSGPFF